MLTKAVPGLALTLLLASGTAGAQEPRGTAHAFYLGNDLSRHDVYQSSSAITFLETEADAAPALALEFRPSRRIGLELSGISSEINQHSVTESLPPFSRERITSEESFDFKIISLGLNVHPFSRRSWDLGIGPMVGYTFFGTLGFRSSDDQLAWGGAATLDVPVGTAGWALAAHARYMDIEIPDDYGAPARRIPMWWVGAGVAWRFGGR